MSSPRPTPIFLLARALAHGPLQAVVSQKEHAAPWVGLIIGSNFRDYVNKHPRLSEIIDEHPWISGASDVRCCLTNNAFEVLASSGRTGLVSGTHPEKYDVVRGRYRLLQVRCVEVQHGIVRDRGAPRACAPRASCFKQPGTAAAPHDMAEEAPATSR